MFLYSLFALCFYIHASHYVYAPLNSNIYVATFNYFNLSIVAFNDFNLLAFNNLDLSIVPFNGLTFFSNYFLNRFYSIYQQHLG